MKRYVLAALLALGMSVNPDVDDETPNGCDGFDGASVANPETEALRDSLVRDSGQNVIVL